MGANWTAEEDAYLIAHPETDIRDIADHLGRSVAGAANRKSILTGSANPAVVATVKLHWGDMSTREIAEKARTTCETVRRIARRLGYIVPIGSVEASDLSAARCPNRPKGYTAADLAWALENNGEHPEAGLMLLQQREFERWQRARDTNKMRAA